MSAPPAAPRLEARGVEVTDPVEENVNVEGGHSDAEVSVRSDDRSRSRSRSRSRTRRRRKRSRSRSLRSERSTSSERPSRRRKFESERRERSVSPSPYRIPRKEEFVLARKDVPRPPTLDKPPVRNRIVISEESKLRYEQLIRGVSSSLKEKRDFLRSLPVPASGLALPPETDELLRNLIPSSKQKVFPVSTRISEVEVGLLMESVLAAINTQEMIKRLGSDDEGHPFSEKVMGYLGAQGECLSIAYREILVLQRHLTLSSLDLSPRLMPGINKAPLAGTTMINPETGEVHPEVFGASLREQILAHDGAAQRQLERLRGGRSRGRSEGRQKSRGASTRTNAFRRGPFGTRDKETRSVCMDVQVGQGDHTKREGPAHESIADHVEFWESLTGDREILDLVRGYTLPFVHSEPEGVSISEIQGKEVNPALEPYVSEMLTLGIVRQAPPYEKVFVSSMFAVPKSDGSIRPIINLKPLNRMLLVQHFKMENCHLIPSLVRRGDVMAKVDFTKAYFSVEIAANQRRFLSFVWRGMVYQFNRLPFGLATAPWVFSKLMTTLAQELRQQGIRLIHYLDDWLLIAESAQILEGQIVKALRLFEDAGLTINREKSMLVPTQVIGFLGVSIDARELTWGIPEEKVLRLAVEAQKLCFVDKARSFAAFLGRITFFSQFISWYSFRIRHIQRNLARVVDPHVPESFECMVELSESSRKELEWWRQVDRQALPLESFKLFSPEITITTDASLLGWGAVCCGVRAGGRWKSSEGLQHINCLELLAIQFGLEIFARNFVGVDVCVESDNTSAIAYINNGGGTVSESLSQLATKLSDWCRRRRIRVRATFRPGRENEQADFESRHMKFRENCEWSVDSAIIEEVFKVYGRPEVDLFASRLNTKLPRFYSFFLDPLAVAIDCFAHNWSDRFVYAFPPFALIGRVLEKVRAERTSMVLLTPLWRSQAWFPLILKLALEPPFKLETRQPLLVDPEGTPHPLLRKKGFHLLAWRISGRDGESGDSLTEQQVRRWPLGLRILRSNTVHP